MADQDINKFDYDINAELENILLGETEKPKPM
jgi:hypothetical protein